MQSTVFYSIWEHMNWRIKQQLRSIIVDLVGWLQFLPPRIRTRQPLARGVGVVTTDSLDFNTHWGRPLVAILLKPQRLILLLAHCSILFVYYSIVHPKYKNNSSVHLLSSSTSGDANHLHLKHPHPPTYTALSKLIWIGETRAPSPLSFSALITLWERKNKSIQCI